MKIGLYHFGGQEGLPEKIVSSNRNDQFAFIDPYPDKKELENEIKKMAIRSSRCTTSALYQINQTLKDCIKQAVPDLKDREVEHFIEMTSKTLDCSLTDYKNLVRMAQRTHIRNLPYSDILFVTNRLISFWVCYIEYFSIDIVISTIIPHSFVDYSLTVACKYLRKKCYCQSPLGTANHSFILDMTNGVNISISKQVSDSFWKGAYDECVAFAENALDKNVKFPYAAERAKRSKKIHKQEKRFLIYDEHMDKTLSDTYIAYVNIIVRYVLKTQN